MSNYKCNDFQKIFKITIQDPNNTNITIESVLSIMNKIHTKYLNAFRIVSSFGKNGICIFNTNSWFAHGGMDYLNFNIKSILYIDVIIHEIGHCYEQIMNKYHSCNFDTDWINAIESDGIHSSPYGANNFWEDRAEFLKMYFILSENNRLDELKQLSPKRFELTEFMIEKCNDPNFIETLIDYT